MKDIIVRTPKEEQFYEVIKFYEEDSKLFKFDLLGDKSCVRVDENKRVTYGGLDVYNNRKREIITFEQWKELVGKKENVSNELVQDIDLDIELLELARKLVTAGRIKDGATLSIIAGNSMKEKLNK